MFLNVQLFVTTALGNQLGEGTSGPYVSQEDVRWEPNGLLVK